MKNTGSVASINAGTSWWGAGQGGVCVDYCHTGAHTPTSQGPPAHTHTGRYRHTGTLVVNRYHGSIRLVSTIWTNRCPTVLYLSFTLSVEVVTDTQVL